MSNPAPTPSPATPADEQVSERANVIARALAKDGLLCESWWTNGDEHRHLRVARIIDAALASPTGDDALLARQTFFISKLASRKPHRGTLTLDYEDVLELRALAASPRPAASSGGEK